MPFLFLQRNLLGTRKLEEVLKQAQDLIVPVRQRVSVFDGEVNTGTTTIPRDDTIPQNTEGDEYMTLSITPTDSDNLLIIDVVFIGSHTAVGDMAVALFQDTTVNALAVASHEVVATRFTTITFSYQMTAGTTSSTTFKIRAGSQSAGTTTFNGISSGRIYGGTLVSSIIITETTQ